MSYYVVVYSNIPWIDISNLDMQLFYICCLYFKIALKIKLHSSDLLLVYHVNKAHISNIFSVTNSKGSVHRENLSKFILFIMLIH